MVLSGSIDNREGGGIGNTRIMLVIKLFAAHYCMYI